MTTLTAELSAPRARSNAKVFALPLLAGILAALVMLGLYLGILSVLQSFSHALEQLSADRLWVGLVATGFGTQVGLYTYLRGIIHAAKARGATAMTGAGTGTSTIGMLACCAYQGLEVAPNVWTGAPGGGHHKSGKLSFPSPDPSGKALVGPGVEWVEVVIKDVSGVPARNFRWELPLK